MSSDLTNAIRHWENACAIAAEENVPASSGLAEIFYFLGKAQADDGQILTASKSFKCSVTMFEESNLENQHLQSARNDLGEALKKTR